MPTGNLTNLVIELVSLK